MSDVDDYLSAVERRRTTTLSQLDGKSQADLGQYFTPSAAARLIASMVALPTSGLIRVLDPGAGVGSLLAAVAARVVLESPNLAIHIVASEIDPAVARQLRDTLEETRTLGRAHGTTVTFEIVVSDLILRPDEIGSGFDTVVLNPPYAKVAAGSAHRRAMLERGIEAPNLYAAFLAVSIAALRPGGNLVAITPRSFANGVYFEQFRGWLLDEVRIDRIHIFESRSTVFSDTGVLQENIILAATRGAVAHDVTLSASTGHEAEITSRDVAFSSVVHPGDAARFIRIPSEVGSDEAVQRILSLPATLQELGVNVSTGRVVDFRSRENLVTEPGVSTWPMVYPANIRGGELIHPREGLKAQWFRAVQPKDTNLLVPAGNYVLVKRFSAKEEKRRVVAGV